MRRFELWLAFRRLLAGAAFLVVASSFAWAQSQFGTVVGTVVDSAGSPIPGVTIHAVNQATKLGFSTVTGGSGDYLVGGLLPGLYTMEAQKDGFESHSSLDVQLVAGVTARADISMLPGTVKQSV